MFGNILLGHVLPPCAKGFDALHQVGLENTPEPVPLKSGIYIEKVFVAANKSTNVY
jgi:hypothetical protein